MANPWPISDNPATLTSDYNHHVTFWFNYKTWNYGIMIRSVDLVCGKNTTPLLDSHFSSYSCYFKSNLAIFRARKIFYTWTLCFVEKATKLTFSWKFKARNLQNRQLISFQTSFCRDCSATCFHQKSKCNSKNLENDFHFCSKSPIYRDSSISCFPGIQ